MKFGQAMSVMEAALPEEMAGPYRATLTKLQEAAPPLPAATVHKVLAEELGPRWRTAKFQSFDDTPVGGRLDRPGAQGGLARRPRGRGQDPVPRRRQGAAVRPQPARPGGPAGRRLDPRHGHQADHRRAQVADERGARLQPRGRQPAHLRQGLPRRPALRRARRAGQQRARHRLGVDGRHRRCPRSSPSGTPEQRNAASERYMAFLLVGPARGRAAARRPAPRQLPAAAPTAGSGSSTTARSTGSRRASRRRWARWSARPCAPRRPSWRRGCGPRGSSSRRCRWTPRRCWTTSSRSSSPCRTPSSPSAGRGCAGWPRTSTTSADPEFLVGMKLNLPPSYLLIHRVWLGGIGVLCQLGGTVPARADRGRPHARYAAAAPPAARRLTSVADPGVTTRRSRACPRCCAGARGCSGRRSRPRGRSRCPASR